MTSNTALCFGREGLTRFDRVWGASREKTAKRYCGEQMISDIEYSPWICSFPATSDLAQMNHDRNILVTNPDSLAAIERVVLLRSKSEIEEREKNNIRLLPISDSAKKTFLRAIEIVGNSGGEIAKLFRIVVYNIVPITCDDTRKRLLGVGSSTQSARGAIFLSVPDMSDNCELQLAINISHEIGHQVLMNYQLSDRIVVDVHAGVFSYVRKCNRPAIQAFHAMFALGFMYKFLSEMLITTEFEGNRFFIQQRDSLLGEFRGAVESFEMVELTQLGVQLHAEMKSLLEGVK